MTARQESLDLAMFVQRHEGTILASNQRGGGAVLTIELPIGGAPPQVQAMPEASIT